MVYLPACPNYYIRIIRIARIILHNSHIGFGCHIIDICYWDRTRSSFPSKWLLIIHDYTLDSNYISILMMRWENAESWSSNKGKRPQTQPLNREAEINIMWLWCKPFYFLFNFFFKNSNIFTGFYKSNNGWVLSAQKIYSQ